MRNPAELRRYLRRTWFNASGAAVALLTFASLGVLDPGSNAFAQGSVSPSVTYNRGSGEGADIINAGRKYHEEKNYKAAINAFEDYIRRYPNGSQINFAHLYAGHAYMLRNEYTTQQDASAAQEHFNYVLRQGRDARYYKEALFHTAHLAFDMQNYQSARQQFNQYLSYYRNDGYVPYCYYYIANCEAKMGNSEAAIKAYEQALRANQSGGRSGADASVNWNCRLERAALIGKTGDYTFAERELSTLANERNLPVDVAGQVAVQRALLKIVQTRFNDAIDILETFIRRYADVNGDLAVDALRTAYLYEAYAYYALKDSSKALNIIETYFERNNAALPPAVALLKIKLYLALGDTSRADAVLDALARSSYGQNAPDVVTSYAAMIDLMQGDYSAVVNSLTNMLAVTYTGSRGSSYYPSSSYGSGTYRSNYHDPAGANNPYGNGYDNNSGYYNSNGTYNANYNGAANGTRYNYNNNNYNDYNYNNNNYNNYNDYNYNNNNYNNSYSHRSSYTPTLTATVGYFRNTGGQRLEPLDCVEAVKTLIMAHCSLYAKNRNQEDYARQDALYRETVNYARWLNEPTVSLLVNNLDKRRQEALRTPVADVPRDQYVITPYVSNGYNTRTPGQFYDPTDPARYSRPDYYNYGSADRVYRPYDYYRNDQYRWGDAANPNYNPQNISANYPGQQPQNGQNADPRYNQNNQNQQNPNQQQQQPNGPQQQQNPNQQQQQQQQQTPEQQAAAEKAAAEAEAARVAAEKAAAEKAAAEAEAARIAAEEQAAAEAEAAKVTPDEAKKVLEKAETFFHNQEFARCNDELYQALTSSDTFWQDVPGIAPKIALLRANALVMLGKRSEAQMSYQDVINNAPYSPEATLAATFVGLNYDALGRADDAVKYLRKATGTSSPTPFTDSALYYLGLNERERGNIEGAKQAFIRLYRDFPTSAYWSHATYMLAKIYADARVDKTAEEYVNDALKNRPDTAVVDRLLFLKGEIALRARDFPKALIAFDMIVDQYPDSEYYSKARNRLAAIPAKYRGNYPQENYEDAEPEEPEDPKPPVRTRSETRRNPALADFDVEDYRNASRQPEREQPDQPAPSDSKSLPKTQPLGKPAPKPGASGNDDARGATAKPNDKKK